MIIMIMSHPASPVKGHLLLDENVFALGVVVVLLNKKDELLFFVPNCYF